jgi:hypothetical protein
VEVETGHEEALGMVAIDEGLGWTVKGSLTSGRVLTGDLIYM